jgi:hypothetical protein
VTCDDYQSLDGFRLPIGNETDQPLLKVALNELSQVPAKGNPA